MKSLIALALIPLSGCACLDTCINGPKITTQTQTVYVPTPIQCPKPPVIDKPNLIASENMTEYDQQVKAIESNTILINKYVKDLESVVNSYR